MLGKAEHGGDRRVKSPTSDLNGSTRDDRYKFRLLAEHKTLGRALEELERPKAKNRQREAGVERGRGKIGSGNLPEAIGNTRDIVGKALGMSGRSYCKFAADQKRYVQQICHLLDQVANLPPITFARKTEGKPSSNCAPVHSYDDMAMIQLDEMTPGRAE